MELYAICARGRHERHRVEGRLLMVVSLAPYHSLLLIQVASAVCAFEEIWVRRLSDGLFAGVLVGCGALRSRHHHRREGGTFAATS